MKRRLIAQIKKDCEGIEGAAAKIIADEREREFRDKKPAKFCPVCGRRPEIPLLQGGRHIYNGHCEKCQIRFVIHIC